MTSTLVRHPASAGASIGASSTACPPGLYVVSSTRPPVRAFEGMTGVPAIVGFATLAARRHERPGAHGIVLDRWDARMWDHAILAEPGSFLREAVRGFFANGGRRCVVVAVPLPPDAVAAEAMAADALIDVFGPGGVMDDLAEVDLVCVPDAVGRWVADPARSVAVQAAVLRHCERMADRFALLDMPPVDMPPVDTPPIDPPSLDSASDVEDPDVANFDAWMRLASGLHSECGAIYGPWLMTDPTRDDATAVSNAMSDGAREWRGLASSARPAPSTASRPCPPSGFVAGVIARLDQSLGPQYAPANERLEAVLDTAREFTPAQRGRLNEAGINCLYGSRGHGIRIGGARTLSSHSSWAFVSTARVVLSFRRWLAIGMRDLVFEPQTRMLWDTIRSRLVGRCLRLQQEGALAGTPETAFFVQCDAETNPESERDLGRVIAHVGIAPSVPAEFIQIRVVRDASGFTVTGLD